MTAPTPPGRLVVAVVLVLLLAASACGPGRPSSTGPPKQTASPAPSPAPATKAPQPPAVSDTVRFAAVGDIGEGNAVQRRVGERIAAIHAQAPLEALLLLGDIIYPDGDGELYRSRFAVPWAPVLASDLPMFAALGNHDVQTRGGEDVMRLFSMPGPYYSFRLGPVAFFALDSNSLDTTQLAWLDAKIPTYDAPWRVVFLHEPPYASGHHGSSLRARRALEPLLAKHRVQLVLSGHEHHFERTVPIDGTVYVVAGTGCCPRPVGRSEFTAFSASAPGLVVMEANGTELTIEAVHADGTVLDRASIGAGDASRSRPAA